MLVLCININRAAAAAAAVKGDGRRYNKSRQNTPASYNHKLSKTNGLKVSFGGSLFFFSYKLLRSWYFV